MKRKILSFAFVIGACYCFNPAWSQINNMIMTLNDIIVAGYPDKIPLNGSPASVGVIEQKQLGLQPSFTFVPVLNSVSGVRMEERSPGSYRLSIRGSLIRSPFGIRNVKIYMDEFPLTDAGGNSYLNLIDAGAMQRIEVLKGPHGGLYGANIGGVVLLSPLAQNSDSLWHVNASATGGSFGLFHQNVTIDKLSKKNHLNIYEAYQKSDGYRANSALQRKYFQLTNVFTYNKNAQLKFFGFYSDLNYQTPGGLTKTQYDANPAAARPATVTLPGAEQQKTGVQNKTVYTGLAHEVRINKNMRHVLSIFNSYTDFRNPFITNYETRDEYTLGARTYLEVAGSNPALSRNWTWHTGIEWQRTNAVVSSHANNNGTRDTLQTSENINVRQYFLFSRASVRLGRLITEAGISMNNYEYLYRERFVTPSNGIATIKFDPQWLPRIAMSYRISKKIFWRSSVSRGYSPPSIAEVLPSDNIIHTELNPEYGWNYETGFRFEHPRFYADVVGFYYRLERAIVRRTNVAGQEYFVNSGGTKQPGLEGQFRYTIVKPRETGFLRKFEWWNATTFYSFRFTNYKNDTMDYSGHRIAGVPKSTVTTGLSFDFVAGIYLFSQYAYTSPLPLDDKNSVIAPDVHLVQLKLGWRYTIGRKYKLELYTGVDNLLNNRYSLGYDLNAPIGRYYNTALPRNFYAGMKVGF